MWYIHLIYYNHMVFILEKNDDKFIHANFLGIIPLQRSRDTPKRVSREIMIVVW
jgi:hypothetical protein